MRATDPEFPTFTAGVAANFGYDGQYARLFLAQWALNENTDAAWNPLACTQSMPGSTRFNDDGVQNYVKLADGIQATIWELDPTTYNGVDYYPHIRAALRLRSIDAAGRALVAAELRKWGTVGFAVQVENGWNPSIDVSGTPPIVPTAPVDDALNNAVLRRFAALALAAREFADSVEAAANPQVIP